VVNCYQHNFGTQIQLLVLLIPGLCMDYGTFLCLPALLSQPHLRICADMCLDG
jgi:hypothetical protein